MDDDEFLRGYDPAEYDRPSVTVDLVLLGSVNRQLSVLLLRRDHVPQAGRWALPGGFVSAEESLDEAAARVLRSKAGIEHAHIEQLYTFGKVDRDPRMRIITVSYLAILNDKAFQAALRDTPALTAATMVGEPVRIEGPEQTALALAFDHGDILALARDRLRGKVDYSAVAFAFLPERFTLRQLQDVHEAILGTTLNKPAFRRRILDRGWLVPTGEREHDTSHRPAELFRLDHRSTDVSG